MWWFLSFRTPIFKQTSEWIRVLLKGTRTIIFKIKYIQIMIFDYMFFFLVWSKDGSNISRNFTEETSPLSTTLSIIFSNLFLSLFIFAGFMDHVLVNLNNWGFLVLITVNLLQLWNLRQLTDFYKPFLKMRKANFSAINCCITHDIFQV